MSSRPHSQPAPTHYPHLESDPDTVPVVKTLYRRLELRVGAGRILPLLPFTKSQFPGCYTRGLIVNAGFHRCSGLVKESLYRAVDARVSRPSQRSHLCLVTSYRYLRAVLRCLATPPDWTDSAGYLDHIPVTVLLFGTTLDQTTLPWA